MPQKYGMGLSAPVKIRKGAWVLVLPVLFVMLYYALFYVKVPYINKWQKKGDMKYILFWNSYFDYPYFGLGDQEGQEILLKLNCSVNKCFLTESKTLMPVEEYDLLVFHMYHCKPPSPIWPWRKNVLPFSRRPQQRYVFFMFESPVNSGCDLMQWQDFFNWTWTYRLDSDVPSPYGRVLLLNSSEFFPVLPSQTWLKPDDNVEGYSEVVKRKSHGIAWLVSHCDTESKREEYVKRLSTHIAVDTFGDCGNAPWPKNDLTGFYSMIHTKYKFYLSFENSLCEQYVTEKFFNILKYNVVPVVYGDADYKSIAPPMSYINALDYKSPKELADYLAYLNKTPEEYVKYFWWKKYYNVSRVKVPQPASLCKLCELLHSDPPPKTYGDIHGWWNGESNGRATCREPSFLDY